MSEDNYSSQATTLRLEIVTCYAVGRNRSSGIGAPAAVSGMGQESRAVLMMEDEQSTSFLSRSTALTHTSQRISPLRQRMNDNMRMRKFTTKTQAGYVRVIRQFTAFHGRAPDTTPPEAK